MVVKKEEHHISTPPFIVKRKNHQLFLFLTLLTVIVMYPYLESTSFGTTLFALLMSSIPVAAIFMLSPHHHQALIGLGLAVPLIAVKLLKAFLFTREIFYLDASLTIIFFGYVSIILLMHTLKARNVTGDMLFGAICIYLLMGLGWATAYDAIEFSNPGSFYIEENRNIDGKVDWFDFIYYSFVTLTTAGYGDINPVTSQARSLSILEAIAGVLFVAVLIARIVGIYTTQLVRQSEKQ